MKKIISLALVCVMMLGMLSMVSFAAPAAIGDSTTTWELNGTVLTISGTGAMPTMAKVDYPWYGSRETITEVVVTDGVTEIGKEAFADYDALVKVTFGKDVTILKNDCIGYSATLTTIVFKGKITEISQGVVYGSGAISSVTLADDQTWEDFEAVAKVKPYNDNFFKCAEYKAYARQAQIDAIKAVGTIDAAVSPWSLENWGESDEKNIHAGALHGTMFVAHYDFTKGEENVGQTVLDAVKNGLVKVSVTVVDETTQMKYYIDDYKFNYDEDCKFDGCGNDASGHHFYTALPDYNLYRFEVTDYGVDLVAGNTYTLTVKITCDGATVAEVTSETGAFTCPENPQIIAEPSYTCVKTDLNAPVEPDEPDTPDTPDNPGTGDNAVFAIVFATVAILGMAVVVTKKVNA